MARRDKASGKLVDGPHAEHRCYAASLEVAFSSVAKSAQKNMDTLLQAKTVERMAHLIGFSLPPRHYHTIRVHSGGDFFSQTYFMAWMEAARNDPDRLFYAYTKSIPFWVKSMAIIPANFLLTASYGGKFDPLIKQHGLRHAIVVNHPDEARKLKLKIDHDDGFARDPKVKKFALLLHGQQAKDTPAAAAIKRMKDEGVEYSYPREGRKAAIPMIHAE